MEFLGILWRFLGIPQATRSPLGFWETRREVLGGPQEPPRRSQGGPRKVLGASQEVINGFLGGYWEKLQELQKVTKGIKCIIDHRIEHPAS